ncbi:phosphatase PAP2 family protein [Clostridium ihumii]|uniref:phosphatase PAP2 family protein n=1 Tax=Clostridium ihumii TaxID=1470356 RepID=UPI003D341606
MIDTIHSIDKAIIDFVHKKLNNPIFNYTMPMITHLGDGGFIWVLISGLMLLKSKDRKLGVLCLIALAVSTFFTEGVIKNIVERVRPIIRYPIEKPLISIPKSYSFPSGHTSSSFAVATILFVMMPHFKIIPIVLAVLIGFSRVYLYVHYPTDVFVGMIIGILSAVMVLIGYKYMVIT